MELKDLDKVLIGMRIREQRELCGLTCDQLAEKAGVGSKFMSDLENGSKGMSMRTFFYLVQALGVSADYLLFGDQYKSRKRLLCEIRSYYQEELFSDRNVLKVPCSSEALSGQNTPVNSKR